MTKPAAVAVQTFNASPERVYDAILDKDMISRFMFGPLLREEEILHIGLDPKVGGQFSYNVRRGETVIDHVGKFLALDRPKHIAFTWAALTPTETATDKNTSTIRIDIKPTADGCTVTLAHEMAPGWEEFVDRARGAWEKMLGVLSTLVPAQPKVATKPDRIAVIFIRATPEKIWEAVTSPDLSRQYFFGHTIRIGDKPGAPFSLNKPDGSVSEEGVVLVTRPPNLLRVTWQPVWDRTIPACEVEWAIKPEETSDGSALSRLTVCEYHQHGLPPQFEESGRTGWAIIMSGIKSILETGQPLPSFKMS